MANNSRFFFVLLSAGAAVGLGNIWLYPYFSYKLTGLFFIPYIIALLLLGIPMLMLEFSIGQHFSKNVVDLFASIRKEFSFIGWLMVFNAFIVMGFFAVLLSWHIIYFFASFGLQWKHDAKTYFFHNVLQASEGFRNFTQFSLPVFIALILAWILIFFFIRKGHESMKKWFLIVFPIFLALTFLFLAYSLTLDNALQGVYAFLSPSFSSLLDLDVWIAAFSLAAVSLGLSFGIMPAIAEKSGKGFVAGNSLIVAAFELLAGIAIGFVLFSILGFLSMKQGIGIEKLAFSDFGSSFAVLAQALPYFHNPALLSLLFFAFLSVFFILGSSSLAYSITHILVHKFSTKHRSAAIITAGFGFLFGLLFVIKPGFFIMGIASHFVYYNILAALLLEAVAVGWFLNAEIISSHINQYSVLKIGKLWQFFIRYAVPLVLLLLLFFQLKSDLAANYMGYPLWALLIFGAGISVIPILAAFLMPQRILDRK